MKIQAVAARHAFVSAALAAAILVTAVGSAAASPVDGSLAGATAPQFIGPGVAIVSTSIHDAGHDPVTSVPVGSTVHPSFVVSGVSGTPSGGIGIYRWNNGTCSGFHSQAYGGVLTSGALDAWFLPFTSTATTTISYQGHYDGNGVYAPVVGPCKSLTFTKADPSVVLKLHDADHKVVTSAKVGDGLHAYVEVIGQVDEPTGTVKLGRWQGSGCGNALGGPYALSGGAVDTPYVWPMDEAGTYWFRAQYQGDSTYTVQWSACIEITVSKYAPTLTANLHDASHDAVDSVPVGEPIHAAFHLSGPQGTPTGSVNIKRYAGPGCDGSSSSQAVPAAADVDPAGSSESMSAPGSQWWQVEYSGSDTYASVASPCMKMTWHAMPIATPAATPKPTATLTSEPTLAPKSTNGAADPTLAPSASDQPASSTDPSTVSGGTEGPPASAAVGLPSSDPAGVPGGPIAPVSTGDAEPGSTDPGDAAGAAGVDPSSPAGDGGFAWIFLLLVPVILVGLLLLWASRRNARLNRGAVGATSEAAV